MRFPAAELDTENPFGTRVPGRMARIAWFLATWRRLPVALRKRLRKKFARRFPGPFDVEAEGLRFRLYPTENYCDRVVFGRASLPEPAERNLIRKYVTEGMIFVDIGANVGTYTLDIARHVGPRGRIAAFEPHPRTFQKLSFNCESNGARNIHLVNAGIGPASAKMKLWSDGGGNIGHASLLPDGAGSAVANATVDIIALADALTELDIQRVDLVKIDIEGFEDRALMPFFGAAARRLWPRFILLETVHRGLWETDCLHELQGLGYSIGGQTKENVLLNLV